MHVAVDSFLRSTVASLKRIPRRVLEIGSRIVNGHVRPHFAGVVEYIGIDLAPGDGVDIVADGTAWRPPDGRLFDCVVCTETLEHVEHADRICRTAYDCLEPGGVFIVTCATGQREPHSAADGGPLPEGEFYDNVSEEELRRWCHLFASVKIRTSSGDLYAICVKDAPRPTTKPMVIYLLVGTGLCGGVRVVYEHVTRLADRGYTAEVWTVDSRPASWFGRHVPVRHFPGTDALGDALRQTRACKVATFWQTADWVPPNLLPGEVGYYLVQDIETVYGPEHLVWPTYRLGLVNITEGRWVTDQLRQRGIPATNVGIGIDHSVFRPLPMVRERYRILTSYRPRSGGPNDLKGWQTALATIAEVRRQEPRTSVVTYGTDGVPSLPTDTPHIHLHYPSDEKLREVYSQSGCYLMTSRHEGFCLPALEAMACECPVVTTDAQGNTEYCRHNETALVGYSADELANHVLSIQSDESLASRLGKAGRRISLRYFWDRVIDALEKVFMSSLLAD